jgi:hypothetical protein
MAAPTNAADAKKTLANPEPSTHGPFCQFAAVQRHGRCRWNTRKSVALGEFLNSAVRRETEAQSIQNESRRRRWSPPTR